MTHTQTLTLTFDQYQKHSLRTRVYPNVGNNYAYCLFGLAGETGEMIEKLELNDTEEAIKESGDIAWYVAASLDELGLNINDQINQALLEGDVRTYDENDSLASFANNIVIHVGKIFEIMKKVIRDNNGILDDSRKEKLTYHYVELARNLSFATGILGESIWNVLQQNMDKLDSRAARGVLKGSGDNR